MHVFCLLDSIRKMLFPARLSCVVVVLLTLVSGCGGPVDPTIPVWGSVSLNGTPVKHGDIEFGSTEKNGLRRGAMILDGKYRTAPMQGLQPGTYVVRIFSVPVADNDPNKPEVLAGEEELGAAETRDSIPPSWNMRSTQKVTVSADAENEFNFEIESSKK